MMKCSDRAYAMCPTNYLCGSRNDATFTDDSECAEFNRRVDNMPMTNADKIRSMSDAELAKVIACPDGMSDQPCSCEEVGCIDCCLRYLQQLAKED